MPSVDKDGSTDTYMRVKKISDGVLNAATLTGSIIVSGAQFNRTVTKDYEGNEVVLLTSFRESGDLEQDCHNAIGIGRMAEKGSRYLKMLAAREAMVEDDSYIMDFAGAYSYMAKGEKIKAPEESAGNSRTGLGIGRLTKHEKQAAIDAILKMRGNENLGKQKSESSGHDDDDFVITADMVGVKKRKAGK
jgi:hypothetical protein